MQMDTMNEEQLIQDLKAGSHEAMRLLYESHKDRLFTLARCLLGDTSGAEDVVHEVFLGFVESLHGYHVNGGLGAYLAVSVANRARDGLRAVKRHAVKETGAEGGGELHEPPEAQAILQEETQRLRQALAELPYEQREVVLLHLQGDLTFQKIADLQGVSLSTAQGRYRYGLRLSSAGHSLFSFPWSSCFASMLFSTASGIPDIIRPWRGNERTKALGGLL
jgi:RNA polymerase sigma-70 factor (ECF subfamily)